MKNYYGNQQKTSQSKMTTTEQMNKSHNKTNHGKDESKITCIITLIYSNEFLICIRLNVSDKEMLGRFKSDRWITFYNIKPLELEFEKLLYQMVHYLQQLG